MFWQTGRVAPGEDDNAGVCGVLMIDPVTPAFAHTDDVRMRVDGFEQPDVAVAISVRQPAEYVIIMTLILRRTEGVEFKPHIGATQSFDLEIV